MSDKTATLLIMMNTHNCRQELICRPTNSGHLFRHQFRPPVCDVKYNGYRWSARGHYQNCIQWYKVLFSDTDIPIEPLFGMHCWPFMHTCDHGLFIHVLFDQGPFELETSRNVITHVIRLSCPWNCNKRTKQKGSVWYIRVCVCTVLADSKLQSFLYHIKWHVLFVQIQTA